MTRHGVIIGSNPESEQKYKEHHAAVWPTVLETIRSAHPSIPFLTGVGEAQMSAGAVVSAQLNRRAHCKGRAR